MPGMANPMAMGMMGGMNPMMGMMGGPMGMMGGHMGMMGGPMGMGMGMPFMSYDTMEDLFLDPDRPDPRVRRPPMGAAAAAVAASSAAAASASMARAASAQPVAAAQPSVDVAPSVGVAQPAQTSSTAGGAPAVDQSLITSALQTALSRVQSRQGQTGSVVG